MPPTPSDHSAESINPRILTIRGRRVILDADLAQLYGVATKRLLEQVRRNRIRFPPDFCFLLERREVTNLRSQIATSSSGHGGPRAFTEHGALMAANVLNSRRAVQMSIYIVRAFLRMREELATNATILRRLAEIDRTLVIHDAALRDLYAKLRPLLLPSAGSRLRREIGFHTGMPMPPPSSPSPDRAAVRTVRACR
jgi:phage regulator Rha-like protein